MPPGGARAGAGRPPSRRRRVLAALAADIAMLGQLGVLPAEVAACVGIDIEATPAIWRVRQRMVARLMRCPGPDRDLLAYALAAAAARLQELIAADEARHRSRCEGSSPDRAVVLACDRVAPELDL